MIYVTGGTGFVGRHLIPELLKKGRRVRVLVAPFEKAEDLKAAGCEIVTGDITDDRAVVSSVKKNTEAVIHLAGVLTETRKVKFRDIHVQATRNVIEACRERGARRLLFASALGAAPDAASKNHRSKWECEEMIRNSGVEYAIFRPTIIFGSGDRFTNLFAEEIKRHIFIPVPGDGENLIQPVFVDDLVKVLSGSVERKDTLNRTYELGGPDTYTFNEMVDMIDEVIGRKRRKLHLPVFLMYCMAVFYELLSPRPRLTRDLVVLLQKDYTTTQNALMSVFGVKPTGFVEGMRTYLKP